MCKVSIIIPVYNVERYLPACLDSVLGQTLKEIEVIAIDDASPDGSAEILEEYAERDKRVSVIHLSENHMQGYGRNRGLEQAKGKYVYFLDSDDMIVPYAMEELYNEAERENLDGIYFDSEVLYETEDLRKRNSSYPAARKAEYPDEVLSGLKLFDLFTAADEWLVYVQRQFWRREFLIENNIFNIEGIEHEDEFFSFQAILLAERVKYLRKNYFIRRYRENSVMTRARMPKDFHGYFVTYCNMIKFIEERGDIVSYGANSHVLQMFGAVTANYDLFDKTEDPKKWFSPEERELYRLFKAILKNMQDTQDRDILFWRPLDKYENIWVYGAGRVAATTARRLLETRHPITGFIVSDKRNNPESMYEIKVSELKDVKEIGPNSVVLVAMGKAMHEEVAVLLRERGFDYFLYANNELMGPFITDPERQAER